MSWRTGLIFMAALLVSFVAGIYFGERKDRPHHTARIWRNF